MGFDFHMGVFSKFEYVKNDDDYFNDDDIIYNIVIVWREKDRENDSEIIVGKVL